MPFNIEAIRNLRGEDETDIGYDPQNEYVNDSENAQSDTKE